MALSKQEIVDAIADLSVLDLSELIRDIEEKFGVSAAAVAVAAPAAAAGGGEAASDDKTHFDIVLSGFEADKKISVVKVVRALTELDLMKAKQLVEGAPATVQEGVEKAAAEEAKKKIEEAGGTVELK